jgi:1-acyl-sn-glycerol-3-phosphate acyltransferase
VVLQARPIVIPIFINGMTNDLYYESRVTFNKTGVPIIMVFGDPLDLSEFEGADPHRLRTQIDVGRKALREIARLSEIEREVRRTGHEPAVVR